MRGGGRERGGGGVVAVVVLVVPVRGARPRGVPEEETGTQGLQRGGFGALFCCCQRYHRGGET